MPLTKHAAENGASCQRIRMSTLRGAGVGRSVVRQTLPPPAPVFRQNDRLIAYLLDPQPTRVRFLIEFRFADLL